VLSSLSNDFFQSKKTTAMKISKNKIEVKIGIPGAIIRQKTNFWDANGLGKISAEYFSFSAGVDITPLLVGLEGNLCQCPHGGFVLSGPLTTTDAKGVKEVVSA
jgi:hypothetical protein